MHTQADRDRKGGSNTRPNPALHIYSMNFTHFNSRVISLGSKQVRVDSGWGMGTLGCIKRDCMIST